MSKQGSLFDDAPSRYPDRPGYKTGGTSKLAADSMLPTAGSLRKKVYDVLLAQAMTADEVAKVLKETVLAIRPRLSELRAHGLIRDTKDRRDNISGRPAIVWRGVRRKTDG